MDEVNRNDCFLCAPMEALVFDRQQYGFSMAGLGPIVQGYSIVAPHQHVRSHGEFDPDTLNGYLEYANSIRNKLAAHYGNCLLTEHGNTPLCYADGAKLVHCFHPHFLLFPRAPDIMSAATEYFGEHKQFPDLMGAISAADNAANYILLSPRESEHNLIIPTNGFPRQFIRMLVAEALGNLELASWQDNPCMEDAINNANENRAILNPDT